MKTTPKEEKDVNSFDLLPPGEYDAEVIRAEEKTSKSGNEMIALVLTVYDGDTRVGCHDWLLDKVAYKLRHFCDSAGLMATYEDGVLEAEHCVGRSVRVKLKVELNEEFGDRNRIVDYIVGEAAKKPAKPKKSRRRVEPIDENDIPF